ncbi:hypothetical protein ANTPLA_LOCUS2549 [Anthophora plagiata]
MCNWNEQTAVYVSSLESVVLVSGCYRHTSLHRYHAASAKEKDREHAVAAGIAQRSQFRVEERQDPLSGKVHTGRSVPPSLAPTSLGGKLSQPFLPFSVPKSGWKRPKKQKSSMCQFYEDYNGSYLTYRSVVDTSRYLGFNKFGKPMKNLHGRQECFNFIKYNPHADINHHNSLVNADMGGMEPWDPYVVSRKPSPMMRATKNSLLQADSTREIVHTTHRYRHSNRWKMRQGEKVSASRRRHESRLFVEANKY